jgi:hypothetical protein
MTEDANPLHVGLRPHAATTTDVLWDPDRFGVADRVGLRQWEPIPSERRWYAAATKLKRCWRLTSSRGANPSSSFTARSARSRPSMSGSVGRLPIDDTGSTRA